MNKNLKEKIFLIVKQIPKGKVMTYGQIARIIAKRDVRIVGWMLNQNKDKNIPCYRVIKSDGTIAKGYAFGGKRVQQKMLERDGIKFVNGRINLEKYLHRNTNIKI